jgi:3'-phosphoadenosine 5'-phosphosulfate sulfotransferase (PAPS reductase)/FAD synthetase
VSGERHVVALSGGKDSAALAIYLKDKWPNRHFEYVFTDSGCELPETYEYLDRIRAVLNINIKVVKSEKDWDHWAAAKAKKTPYGTFTYLPSPLNRWCTEVLKIRPYEKWVDETCRDSLVYSYVGLRADEARDRKGLISRNKNLQSKFPFIEAGINYNEVIDILRQSGLGLPKYSSWRKRSGCYFCFYQTKQEWLGLLGKHPELYKKAMSYESKVPEEGINFTWCPDISLFDLKNNGGRNEDNQHEKPIITSSAPCSLRDVCMGTAK